MKQNQRLTAPRDREEKAHRELAQALRSADWSNTSIGNKALIQAAIDALEIQTAIGQEQDTS